MKPPRMEVYVSVDVETSGPIPGEYSLLAIGACLVANPERSFYAELQPISKRFIPAALKVAGFDLAVLQTKGRRPEEAMSDFAAWVTSVSAPNIPVFVGFNACFDWSFVNWYFYKFTHDNPFGISGIDIKAFFMGLSGCTWDRTRMSLLPNEFKPSGSQTHNALEDARRQAEIFRRLLAASSRHPSLG